MSPPVDILFALEERSRRGEESAVLDLHVRAMQAARSGDLDAAATALVAAQEWEASHGYPRAALHTSHQLALTTNFGGDLDRLNRYYLETVRTLKRLHNREGVALCLRSIGELALVQGARPEAIRAWQLAEDLFSRLGLGESRQLAIWLACAGAPSCTSQNGKRDDADL